MKTLLSSHISTAALLPVFALMSFSTSPEVLTVEDFLFSRAVGEAPRGTMQPPTGKERAALRKRIPDSRFASYADDAALRHLVSRLDAQASELPHSAKLSASELREANFLRGNVPVGIYSEEEALEQEEQYLSWRQDERIALATQAMHALLLSPVRRDDMRPRFRLHSYHKLDVESLRGAIGGYVGRTLMKEHDFHACGNENRWISRRNSEHAYKRLMARCMLEDVAANHSISTGTRCAAIKCLQHIYTEQDCHWDGANELYYIISALPHGDDCAISEMLILR